MSTFSNYNFTTRVRRVAALNLPSRYLKMIQTPRGHVQRVDPETDTWDEQIIRDIFKMGIGNISVFTLK